jgi:hypothetical protein
MVETSPVNDRQLTDLSVSEFVQAVASVDQPVPAGGSVAAGSRGYGDPTLFAGKPRLSGFITFI